MADVFIDDALTEERDSGSKPLLFNVRLSQPGASNITVDYATANGTANAGSDYTSTSGTLTFLPGETVKTVSVSVLGDTSIESNETFTVNLSNATNATIYTGTGTGTILNEDGNGSITAASDGPYAVAKNQQLYVMGPGILQNDVGTNLQAILIDEPANGTLKLVPDGSIAYYPNTDYVGSDSFTYKAKDATTFSNLATVSINVLNNTPPTANPDGVYSVLHGRTLNVSAPGLLANDTDPDSDPLTAYLVTNPTFGTVTVNTNGSFTYTADLSWAGIDSFVYQTFDGISYSDPVAVDLDVLNTNPVAANDSYSTAVNQPLTVTAPGVLGNDSDADADALTAVLVSGPTSGTLTLNSNGSFTYTPNTGFSGTDSFTYQAFDGAGYSNTATVTITVGQPQLFAGEAFPGDSASLSAPDLAGVRAEAVRRWAAAGYDTQALVQVSWQITDLQGNLLGLTLQNTILIDQNAAGYGWFVDETPFEDSEFSVFAAPTEIHAVEVSPGYGKVDLLTVVMHELGHVLGYDSLDASLAPNNLMTATLGTGIRRLPEGIQTQGLLALLDRGLEFGDVPLAFFAGRSGPGSVPGWYYDPFAHGVPLDILVETGPALALADFALSSPTSQDDQDDVLVGGDGNDLLLGGGEGKDLLVGGFGKG